jgi:hypothetical protein
MSNDIIEGTIISFNANKMPLVGKRNCVILFKQRGSDLQKSLEFKYWGPFINDVYPNEEFRLSLKDNVPQKIFIVSRNKEVKLQTAIYKINSIFLACMWVLMCLIFMGLIILKYYFYLESVERCDSVYIQMNVACDSEDVFLCRSNLKYLEDLCPPSLF